MLLNWHCQYLTKKVVITLTFLMKTLTLYVMDHVPHVTLKMTTLDLIHHSGILHKSAKM